MRGSEAFWWIGLSADRMLKTPDEAFDWIYMFKSDDWQRLEELAAAIADGSSGRFGKTILGN
jgi:hypothetical protein